MKDEKIVVFFIVFIYDLDQVAIFVDPDREPLSCFTMFISNHRFHCGNNILLPYFGVSSHDSRMYAYATQMIPLFLGYETYHTAILM